MARLTSQLWSAAVALDTAMRTIRLVGQTRRGVCNSATDRSDEPAAASRTNAQRQQDRGVGGDL
jgi:hypothetical protein